MNLVGKNFKLIFLATMMLAMVFAFSGSYRAEAQINQSLKFQGKVTNTDGTELADDVYDFSFALYTQPTGGAAIWTETLNAANLFSTTISGATANADSITYDYTPVASETTLQLGQTLNMGSSSALIIDFDTGANTVTVASGSPLWAVGDAVNNRPYVTGGVIDVNLGSVTAFTGVNFNQTLYLEVTFNGEVMQPRKIITAVAQAFEAARLGGHDASEFASLIDNETVTGEWSFDNITSIATSSSETALTITQSGTGRIIDVRDSATTTFAVLADGRVQIGNYYFPATHGAAGQVLKTDAFGNMTWQPDLFGSGGGGASFWTTSTDELLIHPSYPSYVVVLGNTATTASGFMFEVVGDSLFDNIQVDGNITVSGTVDGVDLSVAEPFFINTAGTYGQLWMSDGSGRGTWAATSALAVNLSDTIGNLPVARGGTGWDSTGATGFAYLAGGVWSASNTIDAARLSANVILDGENISLLNNDANYTSLNTVLNALSAGYPLTYASGHFGIGTSSAATPGILTAADWNYFNQKISSSSLSGTAPIQYDPATGIISVLTASGIQTGVLSIADWNLFNQKISSSSLSGTAPIQYNSGTGIFSILTANGSQAGALSSADWNLFNQKVSSSSLSATYPLNYNPSTGLFTFTPEAGAPLTYSGGHFGIGTSSAASDGILTAADWMLFNQKMGSSTIAGLGTNYLPRWTGTLFANSAIYESGGNIGIGTTTPTLGKLDINGNIALENQGAIRLYETTGNGTEFIGFTATSSAGSSVTYTFPSVAGISPGMALMISGADGHLYWGNPQGSGVIESGVTGQLAYYASSGSTLTSTSTIFITTGGRVGIGTTTPGALFAVGVYGKGLMIDENGNVISGVWQGSPVAVAYGGTGGTSAEEARFNLGLRDIYDFGITSTGTVGFVWQSDGDGRGQWVATSSLGIVTGNTEPILVGTTTYTTNGAFATSTLTGYRAANDICNYEFSGSHLCRTNEILGTIIYGDITDWGNNMSNAWIAEGPPGYTSDSNDCNGYTSSSGTMLGAFWLFNSSGGGAGWLVNCSIVKSLACCQ